MVDRTATEVGRWTTARRGRLGRPVRVVLLAVVLATPAFAALAAPDVDATTYRVTVQGEAQPGLLVTMSGTGFRATTILEARWDAATAHLRFISVDRAGRFVAQLRIPREATAGSHTVTFGYITAAAVALYRANSRISPPATTAHVRISVIVRSTVPASIDATCATNASPALNAWIAAQQNGSTLIFPAGSCYQLGGDAGLNLTGRTGLSLIGTGSTLQLRTSGATNFSSAFFLQNSTHILVRGFAVDGGNPATGTTAAGSAVNEHMNAAVIRAGCSFIEFDHVTWDRLRGFGPLLSADGGTTWPTNISIHDSVIRGGEMGIGIVAARNVQIVHNAINDSVDSAIDLEPDFTQPGTNGEPGYGGGFQNVLISNNDVTNYGWGQTLTSWFVAANPQDAVLATATMDGLTIDGNRVHIGAATANNGNADGLGGLGIRADKSNRKTNVVITNNTTTDDDTRPSSTAVINLANVENLTVTGNRQPTASGAALLRDTGTTGTRTVSGNNIAL